MDGFQGLLGAKTLFTFLRKRKRRTLNENPAVPKDHVSSHPIQPVLLVNKSLTLFGQSCQLRSVASPEYLGTRDNV